MSVQVDYLNNAAYSLKDEFGLLVTQFEMIIKPYPSVSNQVKPLSYAIAAAVRSSVVFPTKAAAGTILVVPSIFSDASGMLSAVGGIVINLGCSVLAAINLGITLLSLLTRSLATLLNCGYYKFSESNHFFKLKTAPWVQQVKNFKRDPDNNHDNTSPLIDHNNDAENIIDKYSMRLGIMAT